MFIRTINKTANKILLLLVMVKYLQNNLECKFGMLLQKKNYCSVLESNAQICIYG